MSTTVEMFSCPRCGKTVFSETNDKYKDICSDCMTDEEKQEVVNAQAMSMISNMRRRVK